jgi:hypothetical protein
MFTPGISDMKTFHFELSHMQATFDKIRRKAIIAENN